MATLDYRHTVEFTTPTGVVAVEVRELTVKAIRYLLAGQVVEPSEAPLALDVVLWGMDPLAASLDVMPADVFRFTDLTPEAAEELTIRQRRALVEKIREVNADFFDLAARWLSVVAELASKSNPATPSTSSSDPSPA